MISIFRQPEVQRLSLVCAVFFAGVLGSLPGLQAAVHAQPILWSRRPVAGPPVTFAQSMVYDSARGVCVLYGGQGCPAACDQTWEWNGLAWMRRVVSGPGPRSQSAMAYDSARGVTVLFGGFDGNTARGDTWEWDGAGAGSWVLRSTGGPSLRVGSAMAYDSARGVCVLFGGGTTGYNRVNYNETWEWNGSTWTQRMVAGPSSRFFGAMVYDSTRHVTVLFGGTNVPYGGVDAETWEWDGATWVQRLVSGPSARHSHTMVFDSARGVTVLFGGYPNGGWSTETWEWNGSAWTQRMISGPPQVYQPGMAYDANRNATVLVTGYYSPSSTWVLQTCPTDFNRSASIDVQDIFDFLNAWLASDLRADFNGVGGITEQDMFDFLNAWLTGC